MRASTKIRFLLLVLAPLSSASGQVDLPAAGISASLSPAARGAAAVVDAFHAAMRRGDLAAASDHLSPDALIYESGGVERSRAEYMSKHLPAEAAFAKAVSRTVTRRYGEAAKAFAWIATESTSKGSYQGRAVNSTNSETIMLRRYAGRWSIVHIHGSPGAAR